MFAIKALAGVSIVLILAGYASSTLGKDDIRKVVQAELDRQAWTTPGGRMVVRGYLNDEPTKPDDKEAPLRGVMSFKKNAAGDWAIVNWEGA